MVGSELAETDQPPSICSSGASHGQTFVLFSSSSPSSPEWPHLPSKSQIHVGSTVTLFCQCCHNMALISFPMPPPLLSSANFTFQLLPSFIRTSVTEVPNDDLVANFTNVLQSLSYLNSLQYLLLVSIDLFLNVFFLASHEITGFSCYFCPQVIQSQCP